MTALAEPLEAYRTLIDQAREGLPHRDIAWLEAQRDYASDRFSGLGFPGRKDEAWRYSNLDSLFQQGFRPDLDQTAATADIDVESLSLCGGDCYRLVFFNGRCLPALSQLSDLPAGARVQGLRQALAERPDTIAACLGRAAGAGDAFSALNTALVNDGLYLHLPKGQVLEKPVEVIYLSRPADAAILAQPRNLIVLDAGARATLIERYVSPGDAVYFNNVVSEVLLESGAELEHHRLQEESLNAYHLSGLYLRQGAASRYSGTGIALGGAWSRTDYKLEFSAPAAESQINGLYLVGDRQLTDFHLDLQHKVPDCTSRETFKGIVLGRGRAVFDGRVLVARDAQRTDAQLSNANLLLSRHAEVDSKPQLEIYADDVKCSHGTTVGQLDPQQLFYLRSRGIEEREARNMLCQGFAAEVIQGCSVAGLERQVHAALRERLEQSGDVGDRLYSVTG